MAWFCNSSRSSWPWLDGIAVFTSKSLYSKNSLIRIFRDQKKCLNYRIVKINATNSCSMVQHIQIGGTQLWKHTAHTKVLSSQLLRNKLYRCAIDMITDSGRAVHVHRTKTKLFGPAAADERFVTDNVVRMAFIHDPYGDPWWSPPRFQVLPVARRSPIISVQSQRVMHIFNGTREQFWINQFSELMRVPFHSRYSMLHSPKCKECSARWKQQGMCVTAGSALWLTWHVAMQLTACWNYGILIVNKYIWARKPMMYP